MKHITTALLWAAAITVALAQRAIPVLILLWREVLTPPHPQLAPSSQEPLPAPPPDLHQLTRRQLQQLVGTRRNLPKQQLIEMAHADPLIP
jgi:hypothetical protein